MSDFARFRSSRKTPTSPKRLNSLEKKEFISRLRVARESGRDAESEASLILALMYSFGMSLDQVLELKLGHDIDLLEGKYVRNIPLDSKIINTPKHLNDEFECQFSIIELPLVNYVTEHSKNVITSRRSLKIRDACSSSFDRLNYSCSKIIRQCRDNGYKRITIRRVQAALKAELESVFDDTLLTYLFSVHENIQAPIDRHYSFPSETTLRYVWSCVQSALWSEHLPIQRSLFEENRVNGYCLKVSKIRSFTEQLRGMVKRPKGTDLVSLIAFHNSYVHYVISMLIWNSGLRQSVDPFSNPLVWSEQLKILLIGDKSEFGHSNNRLVPLTESMSKQLIQYKRHLKGLLEALINKDLSATKSVVNLVSYLTQIDEGSVDKRTRFFFLISEQNYGLVKIRPKRIEAIWRQCGIYVQSNFGRKQTASYMLNETKLAAYERDLFLGHSNGTLLAKGSEFCLKTIIDHQREILENQVSRSGWRVLKGLKSAGSPSLRPKAANKRHEGKFSTDETRSESKIKAARQKASEIDELSEKIGEYLDDIVCGRGQSEESEEDFTKLLRKLSFPFHKNWRPLTKRIKEELAHGSPLSSMFSAYRLRFDGSPIKSSFVSNLKSASDAQDSLLNWLNDSNGFCLWFSSDFTQRNLPESLSALLMVNAALFGGVVCTDTLHSLRQRLQPDHDYRRTKEYVHEINLTVGMLHIEVWAQINSIEKGQVYFSEKLWTNRWIPDPLSRAIFIALDRESVANTRSDYALIQTITKTIMRDYLNISIGKKSPTTVLTKLSRVLCEYQQPRFVFELKTGKLHRRAIKPDCFTRLLANKARPNNQTKSHPSSSKNAEQKYVLSDFAKKFYKEDLEPLLNEYSSNQVKGKSKRAHALEIGRKLNALINESTQLPRQIEMVISWGVLLCERGTRGYGHGATPVLAGSTLNKYILRVYRGFLAADMHLDFDTWTGELYDAYYQRVIESVNKTAPTDSKRTVWLLIHFHTFCKQAYDVAECDWINVRERALKYEPPRTAVVISQVEYFQALSEIENFGLDQFLQLQAKFMQILVYRFGLRPGEVCRLLPVDILVDDNNQITTVIVRNSVLGNTKTPAGVRQVPASHRLSDAEKEIILGLRERAQRYSIINPNFTCIAEKISQATMALKDKVANSVSLALKYVTGDPDISAYDLRHSYVSFAVLAANPPTTSIGKKLISNISLPEIDISAFNNNGRFHRPVKALSESVGHKFTTVTYGTYTHIHEHWTNHAEKHINQISDKVFSLLLETSVGAYQDRRHNHKSVKAYRHDIVDSYVEKKLSHCKTQRSRTNKNAEIISVKKPYLDIKAIHFAELLLFDFNYQKPSFTLISPRNTGKIMETIQVVASKIEQQILMNEKSTVAQLPTNKEERKKIIKFFEESDGHLNFSGWSAVDSNRIVRRLSKWASGLNTLKWRYVALSEKDTSSYIGLLNSIGVEPLKVERVTSKIAVAKKYKSMVKLDKRAANSSAKTEVLRTSGYEIKLKLPTDIGSEKTLHKILFILYCSLLFARGR